MTARAARTAARSVIAPLLRAPRAVAAAAVIAIPAAAIIADSVNTAYITPSRAVTEPQRTPPAVRTPPAARTAPAPAPAPVNLGPVPRVLTVPDLAVIVPAGVSLAQVRAIRNLRGVRAVLPVDGGQVQLNGREVSVLGVPLPQFRAWTPPVTAAAAGVWAVLGAGNMVAASGLGLSSGHAYPVTAAVQVTMAVMATAPLGIPGVAAIVSRQRGSQLGLTRDVAVLVSAPGAGYTALAAQIRAVTGTGSTVITLVPVVQAAALPVIAAVPAGRPANYLQLYQDSAAGYCPGLSWTVLAAIGQIESGDGTDDGPSPAGALGPMQFMPATWATWATTGFGQPGPPDISNPYDAVPSAARLLCAAGAAAGGTGLSRAIYAYNHATWYVSDVLDLAAEYAQEYPEKQS